MSLLLVLESRENDIFALLGEYDLVEAIAINTHESLAVRLNDGTYDRVAIGAQCWNERFHRDFFVWSKRTYIDSISHRFKLLKTQHV